MKRNCFFLLAIFSWLCFSTLYGEPCAIVNDPKDMRFIDLKEISKFLEDDLDLGKGITEVIGKEIIDSRFRKAGIPDPVKESLSYSIVAREMPLDRLNLCFVLKGKIDSGRFLDFAEKRYIKYFDTLKGQKILENPKKLFDSKIDGKPAVVYPFAFRDAEAVITYFNDYTIISTVPKGDYSLIKNVIEVLDGKAPFSEKQPERIAFMSSFVPIDVERKEIGNFENRYEGFVAKTKKQFKKIINHKAYEDEKEMAMLETELKSTLSGIQKFTYEISANQDKDGYKYDLNMIFRCSSKETAGKLKDQMLSWLACNSSKSLSEQDMVSFNSNKITQEDQACIYNVKLGSSKEEQYQFSSMILSLMMQDKRFNSLFK
ncbi:hypothetical protein HYY75_13370, partial [bacterium]|nr:hypothetical protein [bacterium]